MLTALYKRPYLAMGMGTGALWVPFCTASWNEFWLLAWAFGSALIGFGLTALWFGEEVGGAIR